jgi:hypothetical protein
MDREENKMTNITELNTIKNVEAIQLMDKVENAIIETDGLTPIEIVGVLEMVKAKYTLMPLVNELNGK